MKLKINFDKKAVVRFFIENAEKVVFALFILAFAAIIYGAMMRREKFDKTPPQLIAKCSEAQRSLEGDRPDQLTFIDYKKIAGKIADLSKNGINVAPYECDAAWDEPIFGVKDKRDQPALFDVQDLRATAEFGAFQVTDTPAPAAAAAVRPGMRAPLAAPRAVGSLATRGKCWVVLTGLVPMEDQLNAYKKVFRNTVAYDPANDVPSYMGYYVERAEIKSPDDLQNPKWSQKFISSREEEKAKQEWTQTVPDVVEDRYTDPALTFPLGPLTRNWGKSVAHPPAIPIFAAFGGFSAEGETSPGDKPSLDNPFGGRDAVPPAGTPPPDVRQPPRMPGHGMQRIAAAPDAAAVADTDSAPRYKLFRFFDFSVERGKTYIYQAQLVLKNPNYQLDPARLKNSKFTQDRFLTTVGSTKSNVIFIPSDTQILVDSVNKKTTGDVSGKVYLVKWMKETGQEVYKDFTDIERGKILNFNDVRQSKPVGAIPGGPGEPQTVENTNFISDATVLDMDGGKIRIGKDRNLTEPGEMLLMFVHGSAPVLMVRDELDDLAELKRITTEPETTAPPRSYDRRTPPGHGETDGERRLFEPGPNTRRPPSRGG